MRQTKDLLFPSPPFVPDLQRKWEKKMEVAIELFFAVLLSCHYSQSWSITVLFLANYRSFVLLSPWSTPIKEGIWDRGWLVCQTIVRGSPADIYHFIHGLSLARLSDGIPLNIAGHLAQPSRLLKLLVIKWNRKTTNADINIEESRTIIT